MNIFATNKDPNIAVQDLDDKRLVKMVLETCQLLSSVMHIQGDMGPYKLTHKNHPCTIWATDYSNYFWLTVYFVYICEEYRYRYNREHACSKFIPVFEQYIHDVATNNNLGFLSPHEGRDFVNCTKFKEEKDVIRAYRLALVDKWANDKRPPKWTKRQKPAWAENVFEITLDDVPEN